MVQPGRHGEAREDQPAAAALKELKGIQGLLEKLSPLGVKADDSAPKVVAAAEFLLEGLVAHRKLSRNEQHGFAAQESPRKREREDAKPGKRKSWKQSTKTGSARGAGGEARVELKTGNSHPSGQKSPAGE